MDIDMIKKCLKIKLRRRKRFGMSRSEKRMVKRSQVGRIFGRI